MIRFVKVLAYPLTPSFGDVFDYLDDVATQRLDPPSLHPGELRCPEPLVVYSTLQRASQAIHRPEWRAQVPMTELREIPFSIASMCTREEWEREGSAIVRKRFVEAFIADTLPARRASIQEEIQQLLRTLSCAPQVAAVSHSFRMKCIEATIGTGGALYDHPELISQWILPDQKTYDWGCGFTVSPDHLTILQTSVG